MGDAHAENARTEEIVIELARRINLGGGYVLAPELETRRLFSQCDLRGKRVLELGCGTLPVTIAVPAVEQTRLFLATGGQVLVLEPDTSCLPGRLVKWLLVWIDEAISHLLRPVPALERLLHWRVLYLLERDDDPPGSA